MNQTAAEHVLLHTLSEDGEDGFTAVKCMLCAVTTRHTLEVAAVLQSTILMRKAGLSVDQK